MCFGLSVEILPKFRNHVRDGLDGVSGGQTMSRLCAFLLGLLPSALRRSSSPTTAMDTIQRKLVNLEAIINRLLASNVRANLVIQRKLEAMEELISTIDSRQIAGQWRDRLASLLERFAEDGEDDDEEQYRPRRRHRRRNFSFTPSSIHGSDVDAVEASFRAHHQLPTLVAIIKHLLKVRPLPAHLLREKLSEMEQLITTLDDPHDADLWRGTVGQLWADFAAANGRWGEEDDDNAEEEDGGHHRQDEATEMLPDEGVVSDYHHDTSSIDTTREELRGYFEAKFEALPMIRCTDIKAFPTSFPELSQLTKLVHTSIDLLIDRSLSTDVHLQTIIISYALAKLPPSRQEHFTTIYPEQKLINLWMYLNNWQTIRSQFELGRLIPRPMKKDDTDQEEVHEEMENVKESNVLEFEEEEDTDYEELDDEEDEEEEEYVDEEEEKNNDEEDEDEDDIEVIEVFSDS